MRPAGLGGAMMLGALCWGGANLAPREARRSPGTEFPWPAAQPCREAHHEPAAPRPSWCQNLSVVLGACQTHPRGMRAPPGRRLTLVRRPGCQRLGLPQEPGPQAAGRQPDSAPSLGSPGPWRPPGVSSHPHPPREPRAGCPTGRDVGPFLGS